MSESFAWQGPDLQGRECRGRVEATGLVDAATRVRALGVEPHSVRSEVAGESPGTGGSDLDRFAFFNRGMASMLRIGIPLPMAVREISRGLRGGRYRAALDRIEASLRDGKSLEESVAGAGAGFPEHYRWMLRAGAESGDLPAVLVAVARNSEGEARARSAVIRMLAYPAWVLFTGAILTVSFLVVILPAVLELYGRHGVSPPLGLRLLDLPRRAPQECLLVAGGIVLAAAGLRLWIRRTVSGEAFFFRLPGVGSIVRLLVLTRFMGCLGVLLRARVPLPRALPVALGASGGLRLSRDAAAILKRVEDGAPLSEALASQFHDVAPSEIAYLALAERLGRLPEAVGELAEVLVEEAAAASDRLHAILFPLTILATGALVAAVLLSVVQCYFDLLIRLVVMR